PRAAGHGGLVVEVDPAGHRRTAAADLGSVALGAVVAVPDGRGDRRGKLLQAGVVRRGIRGSVDAVELLTAGFCGEVVVDVGLVRPHTVGPAVVAWFGHGVPLHGGRGAAIRVIRSGVGAVVGDQERVGTPVDADLEGVAKAHGVNLRPGLLRAGLEQVPVGDRVGAV